MSYTGIGLLVGSPRCGERDEHTANMAHAQHAPFHDSRADETGRKVQKSSHLLCVEELTENHPSNRSYYGASCQRSRLLSATTPVAGAGNSERTVPAAARHKNVQIHQGVARDLTGFHDANERAISACGVFHSRSWRADQLPGIAY